MERLKEEEIGQENLDENEKTSVQGYIGDEMKRMKMLEAQHKGEYKFLREYDMLPQDYVLNYMGGISIRYSEGKGRGIFADKDIKQGDLIMVDTPISTILREQMTEICMILT